MPDPEPISLEDGRRLFSQFQKAQKEEMKALIHQQRFELKEMKASQTQRHREWEKREREARHQFFRDHMQGPERRAYVKDFVARRKALLSMMKNERKERVRAHEVRRKAVKDDQAARAKEFIESIKKGQRPPQALWPIQGGR